MWSLHPIFSKWAEAKYSCRAAQGVTEVRSVTPYKIVHMCVISEQQNTILTMCILIIVQVHFYYKVFIYALHTLNSFLAQLSRDSGA